ncbi:flagellar hook-associated protein 3 [Cohnella pontilimi]|uniref:Flagellar hook-associated protein 3 n=1 Tax=Cohnella pontilimi TaxID=2564100 RepID=A0A4U0FBG3_9BACL|nr:flagellar hook-associated protein FlgL [Cohnella pontilimi]TJY41948.1 flagellar hook-associated protein 3 [Cohnella pontilimi]
MVGRVTQGTLTSQLLRNINTNLSRSSELQEKLSTGRNLNRPSDDPVGITYALRYRSELSINERFQSNVDSATSFLEFNDTLMSQISDVLKRAKELAVQGSTGTNPDVALENISKEMQQLKQQLVDISNSQLKGKYVFNGQFTDKPPFDPTNPIASITDNGNLDYIINSGITMTVNLSGNEVFGYPPPGIPAPKNESDNAFVVLDNLIANLQAPNYAGVRAQIPLLESRLDKVLTQQAEVGARTNRLQLVEGRLKDLSINLESLQSKTEDADFEQLIIQSKVNESVYQASLAVGSKIIAPTLVDFLR